MGKPVAQMVGVVALVGDGCVGFEAVDKLVGKGNIIALPGGADQANRIAQRIASGMDLRTQPTPRSPQALGIRPPFTLRAPAAC